MVDEPRVIQLLRRITDDVAVLRRRAGEGGEALLSDRDRLDATKYSLVIHQYADIDDKRVVGNLDSLGDLDVFVDSVLAWVDGQRR